MRAYGPLYVKQYKWIYKGGITTAQTALSTDKSATTVNNLAAAKRVIITPDDGTVALDIRIRVDADADSNVLNLYAMRGDSDHYDLICTLTTTGGKQTDGTYYFVDTITSSAEKWIDDIVVKSLADDCVAHVILNTHGYKNFLFIATTLNSTTVRIDAARI